MLLDVTTLAGTPVFVVRDTAPNMIRVYGAQFNKKATEWYFPAYPPFGASVLADLAKVEPGLLFTPEAERQRTYLAEMPKLLTEPVPLDYVTKPFDHQLAVMPYLHHYLRFGLLWDPGVGKSKPVIDLARLLKGQRFLIVTPKSTVMNW